jgi:hypothetical protein
MEPSMLKLISLVVAATIVGCASLSDEGAKVRVISEQAKHGCTYLRLVTVRASLGPDKPGQALKKALNETGETGGDSFFVINNSQDWVDGASISGEALRCAK